LALGQVDKARYRGWQTGLERIKKIILQPFEKSAEGKLFKLSLCTFSV